MAQSKIEALQGTVKTLIDLYKNPMVFPTEKRFIEAGFDQLLGDYQCCYYQCCSKCGSLMVSKEIWVNVNDDSLGMEGQSGLSWCFGECRDETSIILLSDYLKTIKEESNEKSSNDNQHQ